MVMVVSILNLGMIEKGKETNATPTLFEWSDDFDPTDWVNRIHSPGTPVEECGVNGDTVREGCALTVCSHA